MRVQVQGFKGGDRLDMNLPASQVKLMKKIQALGKPTVLVLMNGSALSINWAAANVSAIVEAWYPGQATGTALADVLFGDYSPAGRLPVTLYKSVDDLPPFSEYKMEGRTYRYFEGEPLFPFGHGLSYSKFEYSNLNMPENAKAGEPVTVSVQVHNVGDVTAEEVVQLYLTDLESNVPVPIRTLKGFRRIYLRRNSKTTVTFELNPEAFSLINADMKRVIEPGAFEISVGGKQPGFHGIADTHTSGVVKGRIEISGDTIPLEL